MKDKQTSALYSVYHNAGQSFWTALTVISPKLNTKLMYRRKFKRGLDLKNPKTLNEKLLWLKLNKYMTDPLVIKCADKYRVREYIEECGCGEILNELYNVYDSPDEINWEELPDKFALKWNFGAGFNIICDNKNALDKEDAVKKLKKWEKNKSYYVNSEMQYKYIPKKIICEKYLNDGHGKLPLDYKFYCFNGVAEYVMICVGREYGEPKFYFFDKEWNLARINRDSINAPEDFKIEKPAVMDRLFEYAEKLSKPFPFVRADFYAFDDKAIFGELTFTPAGAMDTGRLPETDILMGNMLDLNK